MDLGWWKKAGLPLSPHTGLAQSHTARKVSGQWLCSAPVLSTPTPGAVPSPRQGSSRLTESTREGVDVSE